ncbi:MAG: acetamidase/formamidase family protein [Thermomicrobiales bacterium]
MSATPLVISSQDAVTRLEAVTKPVATVSPGEIIYFETSDRSYRELTAAAIDRGAVDFRQINLMTGPVAIAGAEPGDALGFEILDIEITTDTHVIYVARWRVHTLGIPQSSVAQFKISDQAVQISDSLAIPFQPMIGCIATAPANGTLSTLSPCRSTGGNLDIRDLTSGATVWLPVRVDGGLFALGDLHASMGQGEPIGCGLECGGVVTGRFLLRKRRELTGVRFESANRIGFVGSHATEADVAERRALQSAWTWLAESTALAKEESLAIAAALLDITPGGPAGANCVASFDLDRLRAVGINPVLLRDTDPQT